MVPVFGRLLAQRFQEGSRGDPSRLLRDGSNAARSEQGPRGRKPPREGENRKLTAQIIIDGGSLGSEIAVKTVAWQQGD